MDGAVPTSAGLLRAACRPLMVHLAPTYFHICAAHCRCVSIHGATTSLPTILTCVRGHDADEIALVCVTWLITAFLLLALCRFGQVCWTMMLMGYQTSVPASLTPSGGGDPVLFPKTHFWFFGHPRVLPMIFGRRVRPVSTHTSRRFSASRCLAMLYGCYRRVGAIALLSFLYGATTCLRWGFPLPPAVLY